MNVLLTLYIAFATLVFLFLLSLDVMSFRRRTEPDYTMRSFEPKALVIVPCRGRDLTLRKNLGSIKNQKYGAYGVVAVVDAKDDESVSTIKDLGIDLLVSEKLIGMASGKMSAILCALKRHRDYAIYVVADSDIEVDRLWLKRLVAPLSDKKIGISTMFPYFNPVGGFWSKVKLVWGFVGESLLESPSSRFGWGGSLAFRKSLIDKWFINLATRSRYALSDDICITKAAKRKRLVIAYTKLSQPKVNSDEDFGRFFEWSNRQTALTLLGYRRNLYSGLVYYSSEIVVLLSGVFLSLVASPIFIIFLAHSMRSIVKTYVRAKRPDPSIALITLMMPFVYLQNLLIANSMSEIRWRGRSYPLK